MVLMAVNKHQMDKVQDSFNGVINQNLKEIKDVNEIKLNLSSEGLYLRGFIIDNNASNTQKLDGYQSKTTELVNKLQKKADSKTLKNYSSSLNDIMVNYNKTVDNIIDLKNSGKDKDVILELNNAETAYQSLMTNINAIEKYQNKQLSLTREDVGHIVLRSNIIAFIISVLGMFTALLYIYSLKRTLFKPLLKVVEGAKHIASGDLTQEDLHIKSKNEIGTLAKSFNEMKNSLRTIINNIGESSQQLSASMEELAASTEEISNSSDEVANNVEISFKGANDSAKIAKEAAKAMNETSSGVQLIAENSHSIFEEAKQASNLADNGGKILNVAKKQIQLISNTTNQTNELINRLKVQALGNSENVKSNHRYIRSNESTSS